MGKVNFSPEDIKIKHLWDSMKYREIDSAFIKELMQQRTDGESGKIEDSGIDYLLKVAIQIHYSNSDYKLKGFEEYLNADKPYPQAINGEHFKKMQLFQRETGNVQSLYNSAGLKKQEKAYKDLNERIIGLFLNPKVIEYIAKEQARGFPDKPY